MSSSSIAYVILALAVIVAISVVFSVLFRKRTKQPLEKRWKENQKLLAQKSTWKEAVIGADKLLDEVLKARHFKGKTMGERLVAAQHELSSNDMVWFSHKLCNKILNEGMDVNKIEVKKALIGFWQALKDLGAFQKDKENE